MSPSERRVDPRVNIHVPLRFRALNDPRSMEQATESENVSARGIYFVTNFSLKVGTPVEVSIRMEHGFTGKAASDVKCLARVVRIRRNSAPGGRTGIGLRIERYEARASAGELWAS